MNMTGKPVVFFDWDGTLADSMSLCMGECALTLEWMGLPPLHERDLMRCNGPTLEGAAAILGVPGAAISLPTTIFDVLLPQIFTGDKLTKRDLINLGDGGLCQMCKVCHYPNCTFGRY